MLFPKIVYWEPETRYVHRHDSYDRNRQLTSMFACLSEALIVVINSTSDGKLGGQYSMQTSSFPLVRMPTNNFRFCLCTGHISGCLWTMSVVALCSTFNAVAKGPLHTIAQAFTGRVDLVVTLVCPYPYLSVSFSLTASFSDSVSVSLSVAPPRPPPPPPPAASYAD